ncbi:hypothetical protein [Saccharothrix obliqua]|uniref:hypothetical protein n=1 Tax=Saccharothrix obliqua TaxID=2861747 RepID=UPI001C5CF7A8|nr:hypothetical protein [Saccharothrix obliqua]MBW4722090.1 hypothetical protein [Saccharothrix obliqua]
MSGGGDGPRSNLERRYRALLRLLPRRYRAEREEEMVGIFLAGRGDELDLEHGWPGWGEAAATAALAVRVRFRAGAPAGDGTRLVAMAGLVGHVVLAAQDVVSAARWGGGWWAWSAVLALVAFAGLLTGRVLPARVAVSVAALWSVAVAGQVVVAAGDFWPVLVQAPTWVTAAAVWLGFHREAPRPPRARWPAVAAVSAAIGAAWVWFTPLSPVAYVGAWLVTTAVVVVVRPWAAAPARTG